MSSVGSPTRFTDQQRSIIDHFGSGLGVVAGAGTGKSTTLVAKLKRLVELKPNAKFVAISFTEKSAADLIEKIPTELVDPLSSYVGTIHSYCQWIANRFPKEAGVPETAAAGERVLSGLEFREIWEQALPVLWRSAHKVSSGEGDALQSLLARYEYRTLKEILSEVYDLRHSGALEDPRFPEDLWVICQALFSEVDRLKAKAGGIEFSDMEVRALRALKALPPDDPYRRGLDLVLVDEFQDTSPIQLEIVKWIAKPDLSNLIVVGDPKQSIYRFRQAEVELFEAFVESLPQKMSLSQNFRSVPSILEWVNHACTPIFGASQMPYEALDPTRSSQDAHRGGVFKLDGMTPEGLAQWILDTIPISTRKSWVVLQQASNTKWVKALMAKGVPLAVESGNSFWQDPRVEELIAFLEFLLIPGSRFSAAVFLRSPWSGVPKDDAHRWLSSKFKTQDGDPKDLRRQFFQSQTPIARSLSKWISDQGTLRLGISAAQILECLMEVPHAEQELGTSLFTLWARSLEFSSQGMLSQDVTRQLRLCQAGHAQDRALSPPSSHGVIRVMTIHSAKGLEFENVILVDFGIRARSSGGAKGRKYFYWDRKLGPNLFTDDDLDQKSSQIPTALADQKNAEARAETLDSKRLLYVALTRAKRNLVLVLEPWEPMGSKSSKPEPWQTMDDPEWEKQIHKRHWRAWVRPFLSELGSSPSPDQGESSPEISQAFTPSQSSPKVQPVMGRPRHSVTDWVQSERCPRSRMFSLAGYLPDPDAREDSITSKIGTLIHEGIALDIPNLKDLKDLKSRMEDHEGLRQLDRVRGEFLSQFETAGSEHFELSFEIKVDTEYLAGTLDYLWLSADGTRARVYDFKVTPGHKSDQEWISHYQDQLELYGHVVTEWTGAAEVELKIVAIEKDGIRTIDLPNRRSTRETKHWVESIARANAMRIKQSREPLNTEAKPGDHCIHCSYQWQCPARKQS